MTKSRTRQPVVCEMTLAEDDRKRVYAAVVQLLDNQHASLEANEAFPKLLTSVIDITLEAALGHTMEHQFGNQSRSAIYLGINRASLRSKLKRLGMMK